MAQIVRLENISKFYHTKSGETHALKAVSFAVDKQEFVSIVGPSGCGKTTLLSMIAGLEKPSGGSILLDGKPVSDRVDEKIGYMLQQDHLFPWLNIRQNALLGLKTRRRDTKENCAYVDGLLEQYGLGGFKNAYPAHLSGGMRQRAALIRTLALNPELLLLDEPFSALGYQTRLKVSDDVGTILRSGKKAAILVTHDISEAISMSDRVIVLSGRPAVVKAEHIIKLEGTPIERRGMPQFQSYFKLLWEELN